MIAYVSYHKPQTEAMNFHISHFSFEFSWNCGSVQYTLVSVVLWLFFRCKCKCTGIMTHRHNTENNKQRNRTGPERQTQVKTAKQTYAEAQERLQEDPIARPQTDSVACERVVTRLRLFCWRRLRQAGRGEQAARRDKIHV